LPETRAFFSRLSRLRTGLSFRIGGRPGSKLELRIKGQIESSEGLKKVDKIVSVGSRGLLGFRGQMSRIELYLIRGKDEVLDYQLEDSYGSAGDRVLLDPNLIRGSLDRRTEQDLESGEGQHVEFKPFVTPGHVKELDIVNAAVGFANSAGGRIILGVTDEGCPEGDDSRVQQHAAQKKGKGTAWLKYCGYLRSLIATKVDKPLDLKINEAVVRGEKVIIVEVGALKSKPCQVRSGLLVFVRKGATTAKATSEDLRKMSAKPPSLFD
jgi:hypothetical protein